MQRFDSDIEVLSDVAGTLLPYQIHDVDAGVEEETEAAGKTLKEIEVEYKGLRCSALRLAYGEEGKEKQSAMLQRLVDVCDILGHLRHPNVIQFLGVSFDATVGLRRSFPLIVNELSPTSLSSCIERFGVLPYELSFNIVRDVALGLRYLHEQLSSFVHGDLSAKSVLLTGDFTAKISRVGASHLIAGEGKPVNPRPFYLPPEVREHNQRFDRKVDIFSLGITILHIFCGRPPIPKPPTPTPEGDAEGSPPPVKILSQADMRLDYINDLGFNHPVMDTILHCLRNQPILRPEIWNISPTLCKQASSHRNMFGNGSTHKEILYSLEKERKRKFSKFLTQISTSDSAYGSVSEAEIEELQIRCRRLSVQNETLRRMSLTPDTLLHRNRLFPGALFSQPLTPGQVKFDWDRCNELPVGMFRAQATVVGGCVYVGGGLTESEASDFYVFEYNLNQDSWSLLPPLPVKQFGLGKLSQDLVAVGGQVHHDRLSDRTYVFDQYNQAWKESAAVLNTPRFCFTVVESESNLVAMGGLGKDNRGDLEILSTIEVLSADYNNWVVTGDLPSLACVCSPSPAVEDNTTLYLLGGYRALTAVSATSRVHCSALSNLTTVSGMAMKSWKLLPPTPHLQSSALCLNKCLLAVGGSDKPYSQTVHDSIYAFDSHAHEWREVDQLPYCCCHCTTIAVAKDEVLILGGWVKPGERKASRNVYRGKVAQMCDIDENDVCDYITLPAITITH